MPSSVSHALKFAQLRQVERVQKKRGRIGGEVCTGKKKICERTECPNESVSARAKFCFTCFRIRAAETGRNGGKKRGKIGGTVYTGQKKICAGAGCSNELVSSRAKLCFACFRIRTADTGKKRIKNNGKNDDKVCSALPRNDVGRKGDKSCRSQKKILILRKGGERVCTSEKKIVIQRRGGA